MKDMRLVIWFLFGCFVSCASAHYATGEDELLRDRLAVSMKSSFSSEFRIFDQNFKYMYDEQDAIVSLRFIRDIQTCEGGGPAMREGGSHAYRLAWKMALITYKKSKSDKARALIMQAWNAEIAKKCPFFVPVQICALAEDWCLDFLNDEFWELASLSKQPRIIQSVCYVLYVNGSRSEFDIYVNKRKEAGNEIGSKVVENARKWLECKNDISGDIPVPSFPKPKLITTLSGVSSCDLNLSDLPRDIKIIKVDPQE